MSQSFRGKGKKSAWNAWQICDEVTETFMHLACNPFVVFNVDSHHFQMLERLAVLMYDKTSQHISVNEVRRESFCLKSPSMDRMPPTQDALLQHFRRAIYQAGIWTISMQAQAAIPSPQEFAWIKKSESWVLVWITLSRGIKSMQRTDKMHMQRRVFEMQMYQIKSTVFTTLQVQVYLHVINNILFRLQLNE